MKRSPLSRSSMITRKRKCKVCKTYFMPMSITSKCCAPACALAYVDTAKAIAEHLDDKRRRRAIKPRSHWLREAQSAFNRFIRERDKDLPCVSCGRFHTGSYDAGHYRSVGAMPALRFSEMNVHKQCVPCNQHKGGNIIEYRINLIKRIGQFWVDWLETDHPPAKYTIENAQAIKAEYSAKLKQLKGKV